MYRFVPHSVSVSQGQDRYSQTLSYVIKVVVCVEEERSASNFNNVRISRPPHKLEIKIAVLERVSLEIAKRQSLMQQFHSENYGS
jgi:hypothetical protein